MMKALAIIIIMIAMSNNTQMATVIETQNDVMLVETVTGDLYEYKFDGMTKAEEEVKKVLIINDRVVAIK